MPEYSHEDAALFAEAILGKDAEEFFNSQIGRFVLARAMEEVEDAREELEKPDTEDDPVKVKALLRKIRSAKDAISWLNEAIRAGNTAVQILEQRREEGE